MAKKGISWAFTKVYDWKNYVIPARPSKSELAIIESYIQKLKKVKKDVRVAILGSTVEFRSLCHKHKLNVTLIEFKAKHYQILSQQPMKFKGKETLREEDWKSMDTNQKYDLILGDLVLNVGSITDIKKILSNVSKSTSKNGYCIFRTWVRRNNNQLNMEKVIKAHRKKHPHIYTSCIMPMYMCYYNFTKDKVDYPAMIEGLKALYKEGKVKKQEYEHCFNRWKHEGSEFTIPRKERIEKLKSMYFRIQDIKYGKDCFRLWAPIYILKKK